jgi:uncharacterized protein YjbI with pentapeptide repeats
MLIVGAVVLGGWLYWPHRTREEARSELGVALLAGAGVSLVFFILQNQNENDRREIADRQSLQISLSFTNDLRGADLHGRDLRGVDLAFKDLTQANLRGADLRGVNMRKVILKRAHLEGAKLSGADLTEAIMPEAILNGADLKGATLTKAKLQGAEIGIDKKSGTAADLSKATLIDAQMHRACLADATLRGTVLGGADMRETVLNNADVQDAELERDGVSANLMGAATSDVKGHTKPPMAPPIRPMSADPRSEAMPPDAVADRVVEVSDGDTVKLGGLGWTRLIGLDAPSVTDHGPGEDGARFLKQALARRAKVHYELGSTPHEHRPTARYRAYIWLADGRFLNASLLQAGYARRAPNGDELKEGHRPALIQAQEHARVKGERIWSTCSQE